ncbi:hypothetical protein FRC03_001704 [Tulasnella sp. 419]|nr:hypothetical protein FRC03_001704 [Tulasnella sp. 419]
MDFTEIYKQTYHLVAFSPGAQFVLTAIHDRLVIRRSDTFQIARTWHVDTSPSSSSSILTPPPKLKISSNVSQTIPPQDAWISHIGWSKDSEYLFAACAKRGVVNVFKIRDEKWNARIEAGAEGLVKAEWAPDGRSIICFSEWALRVTIWSLVTGAATYIQYPKHPDKGYAFRKDGRYFVLAERHKSKDMLGVYDASSRYQLVRHFVLPTHSLSSIALSPSGAHVAVWESSIDYKLHILSIVGQLQSTFTPDPDPGLGIRCVSWHPTSLFIAVAGFDDKIHILTSLGWVCVTTLEIQAKIPSSAKVWREPNGWIEATNGRGFLPYDRITPPFQPLQMNRGDPAKPNPKIGVVQMEWNTNGTLLMVRSDASPNTVHIFSFPTPTEAFAPQLRSVLLHDKPVLSAKWSPVRSGELAICCNTGAIYVWQDGDPVDSFASNVEIAECVGIPAMEFDVKDIKWSPDGRALILLDKDSFCCAFQVQEEDAYDEET